MDSQFTNAEIALLKVILADSKPIVIDSAFSGGIRTRLQGILDWIAVEEKFIMENAGNLIPPQLFQTQDLKKQILDLLKQ